ncbi:hypothetical protein H1C71_005505, partial [Ictidomys tridecemlineatus]
VATASPEGAAGAGRGLAREASGSSGKGSGGPRPAVVTRPSASLGTKEMQIRARTKLGFARGAGEKRQQRKRAPWAGAEGDAEGLARPAAAGTPGRPRGQYSSVPAQGACGTELPCQGSGIRQGATSNVRGIFIWVIKNVK